MVKIGITTTFSYSELSKSFHKPDVLKYVENIFNEFINKNNFKKSDIILVSNGYPWIDHIPVTLFLLNENSINTANNTFENSTDTKIEEYKGIELCMPTEVNSKTCQFLNTHEGRSLNEMHNKYKEISSIDSLNNLSKIVKIKKSNVKSLIKRGFKQANTMMVRNCDYVLVFGLETVPEGELWNKILCKKEYFSLQ
jgi:hypothetical protein